MDKISALRGATTVEKDDPIEIEKSVKELFEKLLEYNNLSEEDLINVNFTITSDLKSKNPAAALRKANYCNDVALFCSQEPEIENMLEKVIRIMILCYKDKSQLKHVYLNRASLLRKEYAINENK
jgi:chorismate mutase